MTFPRDFEYVFQKPGMFFSPVEFDIAVAFIQGFDLANCGGVLVGFREWLVIRNGCGNNLAWPELALRLAFPDAESPRQQLVQSSNQKRAVELLFRLLGEFWRERETPQGLRRIYLSYEGWLQSQDWYNSSSSDYIAAKSS
jgi:hypothetical protein